MILRMGTSDSAAFVISGVMVLASCSLPASAASPAARRVAPLRPVAYVPMAPPEVRRPRISGASREQPEARRPSRRAERPVSADRGTPRDAEAAGSPTAPRVEAPEPTARGGRTTIVVDIDETLCVTDYTSVLWGIGRDDSVPLADSRETLNRLARHYDLLYLTARPRSCHAKTLAWLRSRGFPEARLVTSPTLGDFLAQTGYKKNALARLQEEHDHLLIGIGDKPTDAEAYRDNGLLPVVVNPWSDRTYRRGEIILRDWRAVANFFETNHELLSDSIRLAEDLRRGRLDIELPG